MQGHLSEGKCSEIEPDLFSKWGHCPSQNSHQHSASSRHTGPFFFVLGLSAFFLKLFYGSGSLLV